MGWIANIFLIISVYFVGDKSSLGPFCGVIGNLIWLHVALKRGKQYDLAFVAFILAALNGVAWLKWLGWI